MINVPTVELRLLHSFVAVAEELSFARAAERLHISQPPLTRQIKILEEELGFMLFDRTTRVVELTPAGKVYLAATHKLFAQIQKDIATAQRAARGEVGELIISFEASTANDLMANALQEFRNQYSGVELTLREMPTDAQVNALLERKTNVAFVIPPISDPAIAYHTVLREPLLLAMPSQHRFSERQSIAIEELADEPFIMSPRNKRCGLYDQVITICSLAGFNPRVIQEANEIQIMLSFISAGIGVSLLPAHIKDLRKQGVVYSTVTPSSVAVDLAVAWRKDDLSPTLAGFLHIIKAQNLIVF